MSEIPHLQAAVSRLKDKPFEILSISLDDSASDAEAMVAAMSFPGIHTWELEGELYPVAEKYNVQSMPTWYLVDQKGVIRARDSQGDKLIPALESILGPIQDAQADTISKHEG